MDLKEAKQIDDERTLRDIEMYPNDTRGTIEKLEQMSDVELTAHYIVRQQLQADYIIENGKPIGVLTRKIKKIEDELARRKEMK